MVLSRLSLERLTAMIARGCRFFHISVPLLSRAIHDARTRHGRFLGRFLGHPLCRFLCRFLGLIELPARHPRLGSLDCGDCCPQAWYGWWSADMYGGELREVVAPKCGRTFLTFRVLTRRW
jgi:hypothetical protein